MSAGAAQGVIWVTNGGVAPLKISLEYSTANIESWTPIGSGVDIMSLTWKTPQTPETYYIRATVTDSSNPPKTASTTRTFKISEAVPAAPSAASLLPAIILLTTLVPALFLPMITPSAAKSKKKNDVDASK